MTDLDKPCDDNLTAMPGDTIAFKGVHDGNGPGIIRKVVRSAGWIPAPKGGKDWVYEATDGEVISSRAVVAVEKGEYQQEFMIERDDDLSSQQQLMGMIEKLGTPSVIKVSVSCLLAGDDKSLEVAHHLIGLRIKQLNQLKNLGGDQPLSNQP